MHNSISSMDRSCIMICILVALNIFMYIIFKIVGGDVHGTAPYKKMNFYTRLFKKYTKNIKTKNLEVILLGKDVFFELMQNESIKAIAIENTNLAEAINKNLTNSFKNPLF